MSHCIIHDSYPSLEEGLKARGHAGFTTMAPPAPAARAWISSAGARLRQKGGRARCVGQEAEQADWTLPLTSWPNLVFQSLVMNTQRGRACH